MRKTSSAQKVAEFHRAVQVALRPLKDAKRAAEMRAYMRDKFQYLGMATPERRTAVKALIRGFGPCGAEELRKAAEGLWAMREREYQYVAVDLLARHQAVLRFDDLPWLLDLVQEKSWWDTVDALLKTIAPIVRRSGAQGGRAMDSAVRHKNIWVRRIAMLHQLGRRRETDADRLFRYAGLLAAEKEFFIRKAIGWALRDYARHNWREVAQFLRTTELQFSGLTVREAGKNFAALQKSGEARNR